MLSGSFDCKRMSLRTPLSWSSGRDWTASRDRRPARIVGKCICLVFPGIEGGLGLGYWSTGACLKLFVFEICILALPLLPIFTHLSRGILLSFFSGNLHHLASRERELLFGLGPRRHAGHQRFRKRATMIMNGRSCPAARHSACRISDVEKNVISMLGLMTSRIKSGRSK